MKVLDAKLAKPAAAPEREVLRAKHIPQARLVLEHLIELPIKILIQPVPTYIKRGDTRETENIEWSAQTRPGRMSVGLVRMWRPQGDVHEWVRRRRSSTGISLHEY